MQWTTLMISRNNKVMQKWDDAKTVNVIVVTETLKFMLIVNE